MKIINKLFLSCKRATTLIEKKHLFPLSVKEKIRLMVHTSMCGACKAYQHQSKALDKMVSLWYTNSAKGNKEPLSEKIKDKIIKEIQKF